jgi:hypothetical protein
LTKKLEAQREKTDALRASLEETAADMAKIHNSPKNLEGKLVIVKRQNSA